MVTPRIDRGQSAGEAVPPSRSERSPAVTLSWADRLMFVVAVTLPAVTIAAAIMWWRWALLLATGVLVTAVVVARVCLRDRTPER